MPLPAAALLIALAAAAAVTAVAPAPALGLAAAAVLLGAVDAWWARRTPPDVALAAPLRLAQGDRAALAVTLGHRAHRTLSARLVVDLPPALASDDGEPEAPRRVRLPPRHRVHVAVALVARARGRHTVGPVHVRWRGPLRLAWWQRAIEGVRRVDVVPGLRDVRAHRRLVLRHQRWDPGLRAVRRRGDGTAFAGLRDYQRGDDPRDVDWKATARHRRPIVREHEVERSQSLMLCLDAGRLMAEPLGRGDRLDHAAAAAVVLADVARTWHDHVGFLGFTDRIEQLLLPARHPPDRIPGLCAALPVRAVEPDYPRVLTELARRLGRRSLVVLFGDVVDRAVSAPLAAHCARLGRRHLVLFVALQNPLLFAAAHAAVASEADGFARAAAAELVLERARTLRGMREAGIQVADVAPGRAVAEAVARYVEIKRRGAL